MKFIKFIMTLEKTPYGMDPVCISTEHFALFHATLPSDVEIYNLCCLSFRSLELDY